MTSWVLLAAAITLGAYLLGSVSWSFFVVRRLLGADIRDMGSGNAGATNVLRTCGIGPALVVLLLDVAKGAAAVLAARLVGGAPPLPTLAAAAVVVGHVFPAYHGLRGGKGVATAAGAFVTLAPLPGIVAVLAFAAVVALTRYVGLGSIVGVLLFPVLLLLEAELAPGGSIPVARLAIVTAVAGIVVSRHHGNLRRLRSGKEWRLERLSEYRGETT